MAKYCQALPASSSQNSETISQKPTGLDHKNTRFSAEELSYLNKIGKSDKPKTTDFEDFPLLTSNTIVSLKQLRQQQDRRRIKLEGTLAKQSVLTF